MKVTFWGVRGSIAVSGPQVARVGGNTTCVEIEAEGRRLIIDAGTGVRGLGDRLLAEARAADRPVEASLLFTHLHWDHVQGFPFFRPAFVPGTVLDLYGPGGAEGGLESVLDRQMQPPSFPVPLSAMAAAKRFHTVRDGQRLEIGPFEVVVRDTCHPQGALAYRVTAGGRSMCFATDTELGYTPELDEGIVELARGVDLLVHDAQYTPAQYAGADGGPSRRGWGHSSYVDAARAAARAGARAFALFHHDPEHDDATVGRIEADARTLFERSFAAREGVTVAL
jgi:phosphoribosyl 1,2-cyclic phosphodiesterase